MKTYKKFITEMLTEAKSPDIPFGAWYDANKDKFIRVKPKEARKSGLISTITKHVDGLEKDDSLAIGITGKSFSKLFGELNLVRIMPSPVTRDSTEWSITGKKKNIQKMIKKYPYIIPSHVTEIEIIVHEKDGGYNGTIRAFTLPDEKKAFLNY